MRSLNKMHASSCDQLPPTTGKSTMGIWFNAASHTSSRHHGRVKTPFVARMTRTSDLWTPTTQGEKMNIGLHACVLRALLCPCAWARRRVCVKGQYVELTLIE